MIYLYCLKIRARYPLQAYAIIQEAKTNLPSNQFRCREDKRVCVPQQVIPVNEPLGENGKRRAFEIAQGLLYFAKSFTSKPSMCPGYFQFLNF